MNIRNEVIDERALFEAWAEGSCECYGSFERGYAKPDNYLRQITQVLWEAFQAGRASMLVEGSLSQHAIELAKCVWLMNKYGYIQTFDDAEQERCDHWIGIAMQNVSAIRALDTAAPIPQEPE